MWQTQLIKRTIKSVVPFQDTLRQIKRRFVPYSDTAANGHMALTVGLYQIGLLRNAGAHLQGDILELGSGWVPTVPLLFFLAGARKLILTDVTPLMDADTLAHGKRVIGENLARVAEAFDTSEATLRARLDQPFEHDYLVPWSPDRIATGSVDIIYSRAVLEHIPATVLEHYMSEFARMLRPGGMMCHNIDNSDHWEHGDKSISRLNFLRYEDGMFWEFANRLTYQNRLRHGDYVAMFARTGWDTVYAEGEPDERCLADLRTLPLASPYAGRDPRDLAVLSSNFVLRRAAAHV